MGDIGEIARQLACGDGIITRRQALNGGLSPGEIRGRLDRGEWLPIARGVYRSASHDFTEVALVRAAAATYRGVPDRLTACWWHGLIDELPTPLTLSVTQPFRNGYWPICPVATLRRSVLSEDRVEVRGLVVAGIALSLLGAVPLLTDASRVLDRALQQGAVTVDALRDCLERNAGMAGIAEVRRLVATLEEDTESAAERKFVGLLRGESLDGWVQQLPFGPWFVDFAWPELKVAVEIDGWAFHRNHKRFRSDMRKRNQLVAEGWLPLSFSWHDLVGDPIGCLEILLGVLRSRQAALA